MSRRGIAETRPYGPDGREVCYLCAMLDQPNAERWAAHYLFGAPRP